MAAGMASMASSMIDAAFFSYESTAYTDPVESNLNLEKPVWILGRLFQPEEDLEKLKEDIESKLWFTYRRNFPPIGEAGPISDTGWGCMLRCGQMMLAQALIYHHLGREWRWHANDEADEKYSTILKCFLDTTESVYSIHHIAQTGVGEGKQIGQWFGPNTVSQVLRKLILFNEASDFAVHVAMDNTVVIEDIKTLCKSDRSSWGTCSTRKSEDAPASETSQMTSEDVPTSETPLIISEDAPTSEALQLTSEDAPTSEGLQMTSEDAPMSETPQKTSEDAPTSEAPQMTSEDAPMLEALQMTPEDAPMSETPLITSEEAPMSETPQTTSEDAPMSETPQMTSSNCSCDEDKNTSSSNDNDSDKNTESVSKWHPLILFIPLRLGLMEINSDYNSSLKAMFTLKQSLGVIGGKPNHAHYFIGFNADRLLYLDPHTTQDILEDTSNSVPDESYHCMYPSFMEFSALDPSLALGFYCETEEIFDEWVGAIKELVIDRDKRPMFEICEQRPAHWPPFEFPKRPSSSHYSTSATSEFDDSMYDYGEEDQIFDSSGEYEII